MVIYSCPNVCRAFVARQAASASPAGFSSSLHPVWQQAAWRLRRYAHVTNAEKSRSDLLKGVAPAHRQDVARILEQAEANIDSWTTIFTDFHPPPVVEVALKALQNTATEAVSWGGYAQAERTRLAFFREEVKKSLPDSPDQVCSCDQERAIRLGQT